jgi:5'-methylthioadenosine phosphorylase
MRDPICPELSKLLAKTSNRLFPEKQVSRGIYVVTDGRHFESRAEVKVIASLGGDVIGQSLCPEVYLAREIGACYSGIYLVVNRAEGVGPDWSHKELKHIFYQEAINVGKIIVESLRRIKKKRRKDCQCSKLRKKTLLKFPL